MKIAYVTSRYLPAPGGVETHVSEIAERIQRAGHSVEVLTQSDRRTGLPAIEVVGGVTVRRFPTLLPSRGYPISPALWVHLARGGTEYDCVHVHNYHALPALGAAMLKRGPLVFTPHYLGTGHTALSRLAHGPYRLLGRRIFERADRVICTTMAEADLVRRRFGVASAALTVIPNAVDANAVRTAQPLPIEGKVVLWAGRLERYKGARIVINAMRFLPDDFVLYVVGEGPSRVELQHLVARWRLVQRVHFTGGLPHDLACRWFRTACVFVSMSLRESFGISLLEAVAADTPVVASDIPAHREVATQYGAGLIHLVPLGVSPQSLAREIEEAVERRAHAGELPRFPSWDDVAMRTMHVYRSLVPAQRTHE